MKNPIIGQLEHFLLLAQMNTGVQLDKKQVQQLAKEIKELKQNVKITDFVQSFPPETLLGKSLRRKADMFISNKAGE